METGLRVGDMFGIMNESGRLTDGIFGQNWAGADNEVEKEGMQKMSLRFFFPRLAP